MDIENFVVLLISILAGAYMLYCLFRPEDL